MEIYEAEVRRTIEDYNYVMKNMDYPTYSKILKAKTDEFSQRKISCTASEFDKIQKQFKADVEKVAMAEYTKQKINYQKIEQDKIDKILEAIVNTNNAPFNDMKVVKILYDYAFEDGHSEGIEHVLSLMEDYGHLVGDVLNVLAKD
jgi:hypothetical protein